MNEKSMVYMPKQLNAMLESCYFYQIIDEACNADLSFNNHFRRKLTIGDCMEAQAHGKLWKLVSKREGENVEEMA